MFCCFPGFVVNGRVHGQLAVSRAIGDSMFKTGDKCVIATPEVSHHSIFDLVGVVFKFRRQMFDLSHMADVGCVHLHLIQICVCDYACHVTGLSTALVFSGPRGAMVHW